MFEALLFAAAGLTTGCAIGFAIAWHRAGDTREELAALKARTEEQEQAAADKLAFATSARRELADAFKALSANALDSTSETFLKLATAKLGEFQERAQGDLAARQKAVDALVQPIRESLTQVDGKLGEIERTRVSAYSALNEQLRSLVETHLPQLHSETANLVKALRQPNVRGRWGEVQLKRVVQLAGMLEHCDFLEQPTGEGEDARQRPDAIVTLPGGGHIVIDSKVPAAALGRKAYWETFTPSPELVVMFLPGEMLYHAALQQDPTLVESLANERVLLATPTSLIGLLRVLALGWREQALARNAEEVAALGRQLYERIGSLASHWSEVGERLEKAVGAYNKSVGALEGRVLVTARKFEALEVAPPGAELPSQAPVETRPRQLQAAELLGRESPVAAMRVS